MSEPLPPLTEAELEYLQGVIDAPPDNLGVLAFAREAAVRLMAEVRRLRQVEADRATAAERTREAIAGAERFADALRQLQKQFPGGLDTDA